MRRSDFLIRAMNHGGATIQRPSSDTFCSSSTVPQSTMKSTTSVLETVRGVVELPRLMLAESAPAVLPELAAATSAGIVVSMSASAAMRSWIEPSLAKMSARSRSDWRESTVDSATANDLAWSMASVTELLVGYCGLRPAPTT